MRRPSLVLGAGGGDLGVAVRLLETIAAAGFDVTRPAECARTAAAAADRHGDGPLDLAGLEIALELARNVVLERGRAAVEDSPTSLHQRMREGSS